MSSTANEVPIPPRFPRIVLEVASDLSDIATADLFAAGAVGVEERDQSTLNRSSAKGLVMLLACFETPQDADDAIDALREQYNPRSDDVIGDAWRDAWKDGFKPFHLTETIVVRPPWAEYEATSGEHVLTLEPGRAFGTGLHATTMLVAQTLERHAAWLVGKELLDVGCGTGILALVALLIGGTKARAIDNDPDVVQVVRENAEANGMTERLVVDTTDVAAVEGTWPLVVANIEARVLIRMASELGARVAPGGLLVLSGVLDEQADDVVKAYPSFVVEGTTRKDEWVALELRAGR